MEFYNEDGHFTKETTAAYKKSLDFSKRSRYINQIHNAAADYQKNIVTQNSLQRLRSQQEIDQACAHMEVVKMRNSEIDFIEEKLRNNT